MLGGKKNKQQHLGYTIVEVMIVLAVSGMMFVIAANFINGKQQKAAFTEGSNDTASLLQNVVEDVTDGHYSDQPITCNSDGSATAKTSGNSTQGQDSDCIFLGKLVYFYDPGTVGGTNRIGYKVFSLAAARDINTFPSSQVGAIQGLTATGDMPQSLSVKKMVVKKSNGATAPSGTYNIGFAQGVGSVDPDTGTYLSGAQQPVSLIYAKITNDASFTETGLVGTTIAAAKSAAICLTDGSHYAWVYVGNSGTSSDTNNQLTIRTQQLGTTSC